jgi:hypothetical protein
MTASPGLITFKGNEQRQARSRQPGYERQDMSEFRYEVIFYGQIHEDAELNAVKARIGSMFKADEVTLARLFSGKRIVIKKNLSAEAADKYSIAFAKAGAICELAVMDDGGSSPAPADDRAAKGGKAAGKIRFSKKATLAAITVVAVAVIVAAALYLAGVF